MNCHQQRQVFQYRKKEWNKKIWIAKKIGTQENDYGTEIPIYDKPEEYMMNVQPLSSEADIAEFGENAKQVQRAVIELKKYLGKFKEFDVAYLDSATPDGEEVNGENANYRLYPPRNQNKVILLYFGRLTAK